MSTSTRRSRAPEAASVTEPFLMLSEPPGGAVPAKGVGKPVPEVVCGGPTGLSGAGPRVAGPGGLEELVRLVPGEDGRAPGTRGHRPRHGQRRGAEPVRQGKDPHGA